MIKIIFFDFDGVILDSMPIREYGFREIFRNFDEDEVEKLLKYHHINGGLSRFNKIEYFYREILKQNITEDEIKMYADQFSKIMKVELSNPKYLISETVDFIENNHEKYTLHIVSGSEEKELRYLCKQLKISQYFKTINGSPTHKNDLVKNILNHENYDPENCILIGDSLNDHEAAKVNGIRFLAYNNSDLKAKADYIDNFQRFHEVINGESI